MLSIWQRVSNLAEGEDITLEKVAIADIEKHGILDEIVSVYDPQDNKLKVGLNSPGPRIVNFAGILKYDLFPFAKVLRRLLEIIESSMGLPVEIEFAVNLDEENPGFYILQLKPLIRNSEFFSIDEDEIDKDDLILYTERGMGNGKLENITDIIYAVPELFNKAETVQMAHEVEKLNEIMKSEKGITYLWLREDGAPGIDGLEYRLHGRRSAMQR